MKKRLTVFLTAVIMCAGMLLSSIESSAAVAFTDVKPGAFYYDAVDWAVAKDITKGTSATTFSPDDVCTRGQVVTFLWRAKGATNPASSSNPFADVKSADFFYKAVLWAVENNVTTGLSATSFGPSAPCNRGQVVTFLWRAAGEPAPSSSNNPFTDVKSSDFYYKAVLWAVENGITNGLSATTFGPNADCNRGQIVTFLYRYMQNAGSSDSGNQPSTPHTHTYDDVCDAKCNECGATRTAPHSYKYECDEVCSLCRETTRDAKHDYPVVGYNYNPCKYCANKRLSVNSITLDQQYVQVGGTFTPSITASNGRTPYTYTWKYINNGEHAIAGATTANPTITATEEMFNAGGRLEIICAVTDADGVSCTPMSSVVLNYIGDLALTSENFGGLADHDLGSNFGGDCKHLDDYINLTGAVPEECTYKWEWSRSASGGFQTLTPSTNASQELDSKGIYLNVNNAKQLMPMVVIVRNGFLDTPVYIRLTVTAPDGQVETLTSTAFYRKLEGSTGKANYVTGTTDPVFAVTPSGGNGNYGYQWGYSYDGKESNEKLFKGTFTLGSNFEGIDTAALTIDRSFFNSKLNSSSSDRYIYCIIGSDYVTEKVKIYY